jgi:hypothetical protein
MPKIPNIDDDDDVQNFQICINFELIEYFLLLLTTKSIWDILWQAKSSVSSKNKTKKKIVKKYINFVLSSNCSSFFFLLSFFILVILVCSSSSSGCSSA